MCNLIKKTDLKKVTVYKTVAKIDGDYYAIFAGTKIETGMVKPQTSFIRHPSYFSSPLFLENDGITPNQFYNLNMIGKSSGFKLKKHAKILRNDYLHKNSVVLKVVLGGEIWIGDATKIDESIPYESIVYAGSQILKFEEVV